MQELISFRTNKTINDALKNISKFSGLNRSELIRLGVQQIIEQAYDTKNIENSFKSAILEAKIRLEIDHIKKIRYLNHQKNDAEAWLEAEKRIEAMKEKPFQKDHSVLWTMTKKHRKQINKHQHNIINYFNEIEAL